MSLIPVRGGKTVLWYTEKDILCAGNLFSNENIGISL